MGGRHRSAKLFETIVWSFLKSTDRQRTADLWFQLDDQLASVGLSLSRPSLCLRLRRYDDRTTMQNDLAPLVTNRRTERYPLPRFTIGTNPLFLCYDVSTSSYRVAMKDRSFEMVRLRDVYSPWPGKAREKRGDG